MDVAIHCVSVLALLAATGCGANVVFDPDGEGGGPSSDRWCADHSAALFCADFDGAELFEGWDEAIADDARAVASERSAPNALLVVEAPVAPGGVPPVTELVETADLDGRSVVTASFDLRVDEIGTDDDQAAMGVARVAMVRRTTASTLYHFQTTLWVGRASTRMSMTVACGFSGSEPPPPCVDHDPPSDDQQIGIGDVPRGRWVHVDIELEIDAGESRMSVFYDGVLAAETTTVAADPATVDGVELAMGSVTAQYAHSGSLQAAFDNVTLE